ncbi:hypothetical protein ACMFMG_001520 [Clarireedia jacksonii]
MRWLHGARLLAVVPPIIAQHQEPIVDAANQIPIDLKWYPPKSTAINDLGQVMAEEGVYGFIYDCSQTTNGTAYGTYNWCNMPHVRSQEYVTPPEDYKLRYVEVIHRHHKRTPYAANSFPVESYNWDCDDAALYRYGQDENGHEAAKTYWKRYSSEVNPFVPSGFLGSCQFPQITSGGLQDSWQHGKDLWGVYGNFIGRKSNAEFRVTPNVITSEVAGMVVKGMFQDDSSFPLLIQASSVDSLEPSYSCPKATSVFNEIRSSNVWRSHLMAAGPLLVALDSISGVSPYDIGFHVSMDHYYDNLSARQAHGLPLPCRLVNGANTSDCVTQPMADATYRLGHWEYSYIYRDDPRSLDASIGSFGVWVAELSQHIQDTLNGVGKVKYRHNVAHDGSLARLLSILQVETMVWPGMGSEIVFELYEKEKDDAESEWFMRALWMGKVLRSSNPTLGMMDMIEVEKVLGYFEGLVGHRASLIKEKCGL